MIGRRRCVALALIAVLAGCHTVTNPGASPPPPGPSPAPQPPPPPPLPPPPTATPVRLGHVFLVVLENRDYDHVIGQPAWPYLNSLASKYGLATQYSGVTHPSIGNYFMMTTGTTVTNDDNFSGVVGADNLVRQLLAAGKTWTSYAEDLPATGYIGPDQGSYTRHHNPFTYFSDVVNSLTQRQRLKPFSRFSSDLTNNRLTSFVYIAPNSCHDGHDCPDSQVDQWLKTNIGPLVQHVIAQPADGLVITFDESETSSPSGGGWRVPWIVVSAKARPGQSSAATYSHAATLRFILESLGVPAPWPGAASVAPQMAAFLSP